MPKLRLVTAGPLKGQRLKQPPQLDRPALDIQRHPKQPYRVGGEPLEIADAAPFSWVVHCWNPKTHQWDFGFVVEAAPEMAQQVVKDHPLAQAYMRAHQQPVHGFTRDKKSFNRPPLARRRWLPQY